MLSPYKEYILKRWNEDCYDTKELFEVIQGQGYSGSYDTVARYTRRLLSASCITECSKRLCCKNAEQQLG